MMGWVIMERENILRFMILGIRREVDETCARWGYYAEYNGSSLPAFRDNLSVPYSHMIFTLEFDP